MPSLCRLEVPFGDRHVSMLFFAVPVRYSARLAGPPQRYNQQASSLVLQAAIIAAEFRLMPLAEPPAPPKGGGHPGCHFTT